MQEDRAPSDQHTADAKLRRRWTIAATVAAVFLISLLLGMWVGGDLFGS